MSRSVQAPSKSRPQRVCLLVYPGATPIVPVGLYDLLRKVNGLAAIAGQPAVFVPELVGIRTKRVRTAGGLVIECQHTLATVPTPDLVVCCPLDPDVLDTHSRDALVLSFLRRAWKRGADVASVCTGAFTLAEAGLFAGRKAATHWAFHDLFRARFSEIQLVLNDIVLDQGRVVSTAGATSFLNLALFLVERRCGEELARRAASMFLIDQHKAPQGAYAIFSGYRRHGDDVVLAAQDLLEQGREVQSIEQLAARVALSRRTLIRRFRQATGVTPLSYLQLTRVERAKRLLRQAAVPVTEVARGVGYEDVVAFRRLFTRVVGLTPVDYRKRQCSV